MSMLLIISVTIILAATTKLSTAVVQPRPDCPSTCGNLTNIKFPFATSEECYLDFNFIITCNTSYQPPKAFYRKGNLPVISITHETGEMRIQQPVSHVCYNSLAYRNQKRTMLWNVYSADFHVSYTRNKFTAVGCDTAGFISGPNYTTGCIAACDQVENTWNGSCTGIGCCETQVPRGVSNFSMDVVVMWNHSRVGRFSPCSFVFLAEETSYSFNSLDLWNLSGQDQFPMVLNWAVGNVECAVAKRNGSSYACRSSSSECVKSTNGPGYRCICSQGFRGNPYLDECCQDINECIETPHICRDGSICINSQGNHSCPCHKGYYCGRTLP